MQGAGGYAPGTLRQQRYEPGRASVHGVLIRAAVNDGGDGREAIVMQGEGGGCGVNQEGEGDAYSRRRRSQEPAAVA